MQWVRLTKELLVAEGRWISPEVHLEYLRGVADWICYAEKGMTWLDSLSLDPPVPRSLVIWKILPNIPQVYCGRESLQNDSCLPSVDAEGRMSGHR